MSTKVLQKLDQLDHRLNVLLELLMLENHTDLDRKLSPERWSVYENMQHLMAAEAASLRYLRKKSQGLAQMKRAGLGAAWRSFLVAAMLSSPFKFKAPKGTDAEVFEPVESFAQLSGLWQKQRAELREFLAGLPEEIFDKEAYRHPRVGMITIGGMLWFFQVHFGRHCGQIARTLKEVRPLTAPAP